MRITRATRAGMLTRNSRDFVRPGSRLELCCDWFSGMQRAATRNRPWPWPQQRRPGLRRYPALRVLDRQVIV